MRLLLALAFCFTVTLLAPAGEPTAATAEKAEEKKLASEDKKGLVKKAAVPPKEYASQMQALTKMIDREPAKAEGLIALVVAGVFWGYVSLVTPCVFPMIPITVSLFLKQSHQSAAGAVKLAMVYSLTIVLVLGTSALLLLSVFVQLSTHWITNLVLGVLFVVFAMSLFGMYDITLPNFLLRYTEKKRGAGGILGTVFGALAFSIVSFTCVAPFLGGFAGLVSAGNNSWFELIAAALAFSSAFASPFFFLALFPRLLKSLPRSGGWLDSVKAVMGFLELAAAFKFFRTSEIRASDHTVYFTYDLVLCAWVAISIAAGLYLLNFYRLPHDEEQPNISVPRLLIGLMFMTFAIYLGPALFKMADGTSQRPKGIIYAWVDAFLLPEPGDMSDGIPWSADLKGTIDKIQKEHRSGTPTKPFVFVDFTGKTCSNCRLNERNVFTRPEILKLVDRYATVQLYTDDVPSEFFQTTVSQDDCNEEASANATFQEKVTGKGQLPLYMILEPLPNGRIRYVGDYDEGKINDVAKFAEFLKKPFERK